MPLFLTIFMQFCQIITTLLTIYASLLMVTDIFFATAILLTLKTKPGNRHVSSQSGPNEPIGQPIKILNSLHKH